jgi:hypothetical protein
MLLVTAIPVALALIPATVDAGQARGGAVARPGGGAPVRGGGGIGGGGYHGGGGYRGGYWHGGYGHGGTHVFIGGYWGPYWGPYWGWGWGYWWDPLWYGPYWGVPYYVAPGFYEDCAELRLQVTPKEAQVYVDGYYAGIVDDFDGAFQRLRVRPGHHEIAIYLAGYHTVRQNLYLSPGQDSKMKFAMVPLGPGEQNDPVPQPAAPPTLPQGYGDQSAQRPMMRPTAPPRSLPTPAEPQRQVEVTAAPAQNFGSLVIRVQPAGADVLVDGERWQGPDAAERLVIQVPEGSHRIEVRKDGYLPFSTTVNVKSGESAQVNVSLAKGQA